MHVTTPLRLEHLLALVNTRHGPSAHKGLRGAVAGPDHDHLAAAGPALDFLASHGVPVPATPPDRRSLAALRAIRAAARDLAAVPSDPAAPHERRALLALARYRVELDADGLPQLVPDAEGWPFVVAALVPLLDEARVLRRQLRSCANPSCRFVFADRSKNGSRVWCEMAVCGNRTKVNRFRRLHRPEGSGTPSTAASTRPAGTEPDERGFGRRR